MRWRCTLWKSEVLLSEEAVDVLYVTQLLTAQTVVHILCCCFSSVHTIPWRKRETGASLEKS